ncbi:hypothetical protein ONS95_008156 [Cadophora gregata]|uniref:uncharacterized protein n=1 Tax=Cadophora gregata TaxID=51156 RepID=UPI0026DCBB8F|nr:uncharacterized protein ONS95_008156 [Cadophora gregata]KAK0119312.1 hypothetical protein ONS96_012367 [Cadophora gregata f. sp. sojae]KAK0126567.1 hypothetical protein ONS95_008156 [Cadophora gregata]
MPHREAESPRRPELSGSITSSVANEAFLLDSSPPTQQLQQQQIKRHTSNYKTRSGTRRNPIIPTETLLTNQAQFLHHMLDPSTPDATILCDKIKETNAAIAAEWKLTVKQIAASISLVAVILTACAAFLITVIVWAVIKVASLFWL